MIYILAIVLQLAAVILLIGNTDIMSEKVIKSYCQRHKVIAMQNDGSLLDSSGLKEAITSVWTNRIAFCYLAAGYLIGVLGICTMDGWNAFGIIGVLATVIFFITFIIEKRTTRMFPGIGIDELAKGKRRNYFEVF